MFRITKIIFKRVIDPITHSDFIYKFTQTCAREDQLVRTLHKFSDDIIRKRKQFLREKMINDVNGNNHEKYIGKKQKLAFLDLLLQFEINGKPLSDEGIREEVDTFMFAGHDTVTSAITFTLLNLAKYPIIQQQVYEECQEICEGKNSLSLQDLKQMSFLEKVIKESLRLYPSVSLARVDFLEYFIIFIQNVL